MAEIEDRSHRAADLIHGLSRNPLGAERAGEGTARWDVARQHEHRGRLIARSGRFRRCEVVRQLRAEDRGLHGWLRLRDRERPGPLRRAPQTAEDAIGKTGGEREE